MSKSKGTDHIEDMLEWQEKQYTTWEYPQMGKLPPHLAAPGNKRNAAILFFVQAVMGMGFVALYLIKGDSEDTLGNRMFLGILFAYSILCLMAGINYIRKQKIEKLIRKEQRANTHKKGKKHR